MDYKEACSIIGGLSQPSKMPWFGFNTPATKCITGSKLRKIVGSTCGACYALKGRYMFPKVQAALDRRYHAISDPRFEDAFVLVLTTLYNRSKLKYTLKGKKIKENRFRWHDSGDLASLEHLTKINNIALRTPFLRHWLPTRETTVLKLWTGPFAPNLNVRFSAPMVGALLNATVLDVSQSTVGRDKDKKLHQCPAPKQDNQCKNCSACWTSSVKVVNYHLH